jgi:hypothetical protein
VTGERIEAMWRGFDQRAHPLRAVSLEDAEG